MRLIVGLGNPGDKYQKNRHNIGFIVLDALADQNGFSPWREKFDGLIADGAINGQKIILLKPQTYMNLSGNAVQKTIQFYKIKPEEILVIHDELELPPGKMRIKQGGGHGGHNGLKDIDRHVGKNYHRMRLGIGRPPAGSHEDAVSNYVLSDFAKADQNDWLPKMIDGLVDHFDMVFDVPEKLMTKMALVMKGKA